MNDNKETPKKWDNQKGIEKSYMRWGLNGEDLWKVEPRIIKGILHFDTLCGKKGDSVEVIKMFRIQDKHFTNGFAARIRGNGSECIVNCYSLHSFKPL